jgi:hypothetical protein
VAHANARTTVFARRLIVDRVLATDKPTRCVNNLSGDDT